MKKIIKRHGNVELEYKFYACPDCGDSIQTIRTRAYNHSVPVELVIAFCCDCMEIKGYIITECE